MKSTAWVKVVFSHDCRVCLRPEDSGDEAGGELMVGVLSKSLKRKKTLFPRGHVPFPKVVLRCFLLESDCSYETVVENSGRISACFCLEGSFSRGILPFSS